MPSNNLLGNNQLVNNLDFKQTGFSQVNMTQTGPRIKRTIDGDDLPVPAEIYKNVGGQRATIAQNQMIQRSGISETQSDFNSGLHSINNRDDYAPDGAKIITQNVPLQMCQSNYDGDMKVQTSYYQSEIPSESFQSAEQNAMFHEMKAKKKQQDKEAKLMQFQSKTKANAMRKMREETDTKRLTTTEMKKQ